MKVNKVYENTNDLTQIKNKMKEIDSFFMDIFKFAMENNIIPDDRPNSEYEYENCNGIYIGQDIENDNALYFEFLHGENIRCITFTEEESTLLHYYLYDKPKYKITKAADKFNL